MTQRRNVVAKHVLDARHVRKIREGFSWIDRRFVREEWIDRLSVEENALYFFFVAVADKDGLSFYSDGRIVTMLKIDMIDSPERERASSSLASSRGSAR